MTTDSLIDAESAERVGQVAATATGEVNRRDWQRWAASVGDHNPLWFDAEYARAAGYDDADATGLSGWHLILHDRVCR